MKSQIWGRVNGGINYECRLRRSADVVTQACRSTRRGIDKTEEFAKWRRAQPLLEVRFIDPTALYQTFGKRMVRERGELEG